MSATRPAIELSIGIIARSALGSTPGPPSTAAKTSSKDAHGSVSQSG